MKSSARVYIRRLNPNQVTAVVGLKYPPSPRLNSHSPLTPELNKQRLHPGPHSKFTTYFLQLTPPLNHTLAPQLCSFPKSTSSPRSSSPPSPPLLCQKVAFPTVVPATILCPVATAEPASGSQPPFGPCWSAEPTLTSLSRVIAIRGISSVSRMVGAAHMERPSSVPTFRRALCQGAMLELVRRRRNLFG